MNQHAVTTGDRNAFERYAEAVSRTTIVGHLLKFHKGEYVAGQGEEEIPEGTKLVAIMDEWMIGWVKWEGGKPVDMEMGRVADGYIPRSGSNWATTTRTSGKSMPK